MYKSNHKFIPHSLLQHRDIVVIGAFTLLEKLGYGAEDRSTCGREAVKSVLRLFDELVKCDEEGVLKGVRKVISG